MTQTFKIKEGDIFFESDKVIILDNSKKQNLVQLFFTGIWVIYGTLSIFRSLKTGDQFLLWSGLFIGIANFVVFIFTLFRSNKSEVLFGEIKSIKVKQRFSNTFLHIRLKNYRLRRVNGVENYQELEDYIKTKIK
jgi:hypothetical protein